MKILGRQITFEIKRCSECGKLNSVITIHTKKWFKGKKVKLDNL